MKTSKHHRARLAVPLLLMLTGCGAEPDLPPTFSRDIAPIIFERCSACHRPGENAPFPLLTYEDVQRRARQIGEVTHSRYMPPWLPEPGHGDFAASARLTEAQIATIQRWVSEGAVEGSAAHLPPAPVFTESWQLGTPDLVVEMPEAYTLAASGPDVYRNFVISDPVDTTRFVKAIEFRPGNNRVLHHAFVLADETDGSRRQDDADDGPGFDGIHPPESAAAPGGFFLSWTPGRVPFAGIDGMSWRLEKGTDLVFQLHLQPTGKVESVRSKVGLYFDDGPPTQVPYTVGVFSKEMDIPAGDAEYVVEASYRFPIDVDVLAVLPHAHFLAREMQGTAHLPDGTVRDLLLIERWDFNWQAAYRYQTPVLLPKGTEVAIRYVYDNSSANVFNPNHPPKRVTYGLQSADEMCEFWLQVLPRRPEDLEILRRDYERVLVVQVEKDSRRALREDPNDVQAMIRLGQSLFTQGNDQEALRAYRNALKIDRTAADAHVFSALVFERNGNLEGARQEYERALAVRPDDYKTHFSLGSLHFRAQRFDDAGRSYQEAVRLNPNDFRSNLQLGVVLAQTGRPDLAIPHFQLCTELRPDDPDARRNLELARSMLR